MPTNNIYYCKIVMFSSSGTTRSIKVSSWTAYKERNIGNYFPTYTVLCPSRFESSQTPLSESQLEHCRSQSVASDMWLHVQYIVSFHLRICDKRSVDSSKLKCEGMQYITEACVLFLLKGRVARKIPYI